MDGGACPPIRLEHECNQGLSTAICQARCSGGPKSLIISPGEECTLADAPHRCNVKVVEAYRDYTPSVDANLIVRQLLDTVPEKYLRGLDCILLTNEAALPRRDRIGRVWSRKRKFDKSRVLGRYYRRNSQNPAYIELRVDKILRWMEKVPAASLFRKVLFGHVLFHEIGHHIHRTIRPEYKQFAVRQSKTSGSSQELRRTS
jgi:hypothetical protein